MKIFKEEQRFRQWWLYVILFFATLPPIVIVFQDYMASDKSLESNSENFIALAIGLTVTAFMFFLKLKTRIDEYGIHFQFVPFHLKRKTILWKEIATAKVRKYDPITEYGGWGIKGGFFWNKKKGVAYNVSGDIGIQLELKNGKKILIGTQKETEANRVLANYLKDVD